MELSRRKFFTGLGAALITAPAIVRVGSLMPIKGLPLEAPALPITKLDVLYGSLDVRVLPISVDNFALDDFTARIMQPMMTKLADQVADSIMNGSPCPGFPGLLDPQKMYSYNSKIESEISALLPKTPWIKPLV